jgi:hypothetical protein
MDMRMEYLHMFGVGNCIREKCSGKMYNIYATITGIGLLGNLQMTGIEGKCCVK